MTTSPTTPPPAPPSGKTDSGEHVAADRSVTMRFGKKWRISIPLSGMARYVLVPVMTAMVPLIISLRAPTKTEVKAEVRAEATKKAEEVRAATAEPIDDHAVELARTRAELARLATIVSFYENERKTLAADPSQHTPRRKKRGPEIEKKVAAATRDLKLIAARANEPAPLSAPKTLPGDAPKEPAPPQAASPKAQQGAAGGANP
jgi:hypothetical protein